MLQHLQIKNQVPRLLLHSCCAPCSTQVISYLTQYFDITILYYNPNIEPREEYEKRKNEQIKFIKEFNSTNKLEFLDSDYENEKFKEVVINLENEPEGGSRCSKCFELRLKKAVRLAKELDYDYFGTTLTVSPHKNSIVINEIGIDLEKQYDVKFLISDFKKENGYKKSIEYAKEYNLYRQDYCGCLFSKRDDF